MSPTTSLTASQAAGQTPATGTAAAASASNPPVSEDMFLQLLVAQLQNQDPLNPADGTQFLTQLAQFSQLEQSVNMSTDLSAIRSDLDQLVGQTQTATQT